MSYYIARFYVDIITYPSPYLVAYNRLVSQMRATLAASHEPAGKLW